MRGSAGDACANSSATSAELVAAASDNDPTNVGTAAWTGARTGYQLSWVALLVAPLLGVVQTIAAQVGVVAGDDLQSLTRKRFGPGVSALFMVPVVMVNIVTIAADLGAGAAGLGLLVGSNSRWPVLALGLAVSTLLLVGRYDQVVGVLRYLVGFLAFGAAAVLARPDWARLMRASLVPSLSWHSAALSGALALLGTTLTSYVYLWETIGRGIEERPSAAQGRWRASEVARSVAQSSRRSCCGACLSPPPRRWGRTTSPSVPRPMQPGRSTRWRDRRHPTSSRWA